MIIELYTDKPGKSLVKCDGCNLEHFVRRVSYVTSKEIHYCRSCSNKRNGAARKGKYAAWNSGKRYSIRETERTEYVNSSGYLEVWCGRGDGSRGRKDGYRLKHHLAMEDALGRPLEAGEVVHHVDGDKLNNDPTNLHLCLTAAEHRKIHKQLEVVSMDLVKSGRISFKDGKYEAKDD